MKDKNGKELRKGDHVRFSYGEVVGQQAGEVIDLDPRLGRVLVRFNNGTRHWARGEHLTLEVDQ